MTHHPEREIYYSNQKMSSSEIDNKTFEILVNEHHRRVMAFALSLVKNPDIAEDIVQESFITAYHKLDTFESHRDFGTWVRGIVRNKYREWARSNRERYLEPEILEALDQQFHHWDNASDGDNNALSALRKCLNKLPELIRRTVDCFYFKQLNGINTATHLDVSEGVVRKRLQRGREQLFLCINESLEVNHD
jgi:RNA polymerase sigma-70 factor